MTNRTAYSSVEHLPGDTQALPARRETATTWSIRGASITAGVALLLMSVVAIFGNFLAVRGLITEARGPNRPGHHGVGGPVPTRHRRA